MFKRGKRRECRRGRAKASKAGGIEEVYYTDNQDMRQMAKSRRQKRRE
jgi:hypothetical protein